MWALPEQPGCPGRDPSSLGPAQGLPGVSLGQAWDLPGVSISQARDLPEVCLRGISLGSP